MSRSLLCLAAAGFLFPSAFPAMAQFQEPTKDELQMTSDPKAPGAEAVYLYREEVQDDSSLTVTYYERLKILTEKGIGKATIRYTHDPSVKFEVEGRTIHKDGSVVPMTDKPSDLMEFKTKDLQVNTLVLTLPSVEVGSILEYRVKFKDQYSTFPTWMIQQDLFVHKAHYSYKAESNFGVNYLTRLVGDARVVDNKKGLFTLDLTDVPALPKEDWMPPLNTFKWRVSFFYTRFKTTQEFWEAAEKYWADFARDFTNPTGTLKKAVATIVLPTDTETVKAQKIYAAVMKLENTDFTREKTKAERKKEKIKDIHNAQDVWRDQSGNGDEIALLYVALCRAAGLNVVPMKVVDRSRALFDEGLLNENQMDDYIAVAQLDGKEVYLDPGQKVCPFGELHWKHTIASGFRLADKTAKIEMTKSASYKGSNMVRTADLTIDATGAVQGAVHCILQGQEAIYWRQIALENDEEEVKKKFNEWMNAYLPEGVQGEFDHFLALDDINTNLVANVHVTGNLGAVTGKRFFLPGLFFESKSKHPFVAEEKRVIPVDVHFPRLEQDQVVYHIPAGFTLESSPRTASIQWPDHALLSISAIARGSNVEVTRKLVYNYTILSPADYGALRDFYQKVAAADQQQLILTRAAPPAGN